MKPIRLGDRGSAVEDIQKRLRMLGFELGRAGVDGLFFGATAEAVKSFQLAHDLTEDGYVGDETWAALVDATFTLGDRTLYLRVPHFHGADIEALQRALNVLGFACGQVDGIFGRYTERAVREFQRNAGLPVDGIVGADTVREIEALKHAWQGKQPVAHSNARVDVSHRAVAPQAQRIVFAGVDAVGTRIAKRLVNLAQAAEAAWVVEAGDGESTLDESTDLVVEIVSDEATSGELALHDATLVWRLGSALASAGGSVRVAVPAVAGDELAEQRIATRLLDAVFAALEQGLA